MSQIKDFSFQGKIWLGTRTSAGKAGALTQVGDAPALQLKLTAARDNRTESMDGQRVQSATVQKSKEAALSMTLNYFGSKQLALGLYGNVNTIAAGTFTAESLPTGLVAGDGFILDNSNVSDVVITDSAVGPATLTPNTDYEMEPSGSGIGTLLNAGAYTQPFKAAGSMAARVDLAMFSAPIPSRYLILDGLNTTLGDDYGKRILVRLYQCVFDPVGQLDFISDTFGQLQLTGTVLYDALNAADPLLGGFGKLELPDESA